jgi:ribosome-associated protein
MQEKSTRHASTFLDDTNENINSNPGTNLDLEQISRNAHSQESQSYHLVRLIATAADDRKAEDIMILHVGEISYLADYFVIVTGFSKVQVRAISQAIDAQVEEDLQRLPLRVQGQAEGSWIVKDYGDVIAHIMLPEERDFYNLEAFWGHGEQITFDSTNN